jgi:protein-S-isoprenylcysteine O-methyltransferase Ste14
MYVGLAMGWIGLWVVFGHADPVAIAAVGAVALGVHLFVVFYEEPTLRRKFGAEYEASRALGSHEQEIEPPAEAPAVEIR